MQVNNLVTKYVIDCKVYLLNIRVEDASQCKTEWEGDKSTPAKVEQCEEIQA